MYEEINQHTSCSLAQISPNALRIGEKTPASRLEEGRSRWLKYGEWALSLRRNRIEKEAHSLLAMLNRFFTESNRFLYMTIIIIVSVVLISYIQSKEIDRRNITKKVMYKHE